MNRVPRCVKRPFHGGLMRRVGKVINRKAKPARSKARAIIKRNGLTMRVEG